MKLVLILAITLCMPLPVKAQDGRKWNNLNAKYAPDSFPGIEQMISNAIKAGEKDTAAASKIFRIAIARAIEANDFNGAGRAYYEMGEMYFRHKNHNRSLGAFINAKEYFVKTGAEKELAIINFKMGRTQYYRGNYKLASGHLIYAMRSAKQQKLKNLESDVLEYMGILYHAMPSPRYQSIDLLKKSLAIKQQLNNENGALRILEKLAGIYYDQKKFDSSFYCSQASIKLAEKLALQYDANLSKLSQVPTLLRMQKQQEARQALVFIKTLIEDSLDLNMNIRYYIQAGNYNVALMDTIAAQKNYDSALQIAQSAGFPELSSLVYSHMAGAYYYNNDFKKAYEYQLKYSNHMISLYSKENFTTFKELEYIFKTNVTEEEVKYLNIQNEIKEVRLKNEKTLRTILVVSSVGFLLCASIIFYLYRRQKRKGLIIERQAAELQVLMKEIHHRVKNNLQVISSLLDLQSLTIRDAHAAEAIRESRNRVQAMALIHKDLYSDKPGNGVEMQGYIKELTANLFSSYNVNKSKVLLKTKIDPVVLDVDLIILIGLVMNELVSNALKYAFRNQETGLLFITLQQKRDELLLEIKDDGVGFPLGFSIDHIESYGYKLVKAFAHKLKARLNVFNNGGACVQLYIRKFKIDTGV